MAGQACNIAIHVGQGSTMLAFFLAECFPQIEVI